MYKNNLKLGVFVASGLVLFILGIYYLGKMQNMFQSNIIVYTEFRDVKGLQSGNNVRFMGINIGTVTDISILSDSIVKVKMGIDKNVGKFIKKDAQAEIDNEGVMGSKIITIQAGDTDSKPIEENDILQSFTSISYEDILNELENTATLTGHAAKNLVKITHKINTGSGDLAKFINDDAISQNIEVLSKQLAQVTFQAQKILKKVNTGNNDIAKLLNENTLTTKISSSLSNADSATYNFKVASNEFLIATQSINHGNGVIRKLLHDSLFSSEVDTTLYNINNGIGIVVETAETVRDSWIVSLFSGKKKDKKNKKNN